MIRVLDDRVVDRIKAGEVVERPASIVKELVENALDAGARVLRVELRAGGRELVRVVDDGCGMDRTDATLCIERHATSKIATDEDLFRVTTLGFRGEAIPSIAAVCRFELRTRPREAAVGTRVVVDAGKLVTVEETGCAPGTEIEARSLFSSVPVRRKFLRTVQTELSHCLEAVVRQALPRPDLDVTVLHEGAVLLRAPRARRGGGGAADLLGPDGAALVPVAFERGALRVRALCSPVGVHRAEGGTWLYVNGRYVRDPLLRRAVGDAYAGIVPKGRHPTVVLELQIPPAEVDVNVHPAKTEVRFHAAGAVLGAVAEGLRTGLQGHGIRRPVVAEPFRPPPDPAPPSLEPQVPLPVRAPPGRLFVEDRADPPPWVPPPAPASGDAPPPRSVQAEPPPGMRPDDLLPVPRFADLRVVGQLARTYVLCEGGGELVIVDQHAAHERVTLHRLRRSERERLGAGQRLLSPPVVELAPARARALHDHLDVLGRYGLEVEPFGGSAFVVKQVPEALSGVDAGGLLADVAADLAEGGDGRPARERVDGLLATMACHASVRAGQVLSPYEMRELLRALDEVDFSVCAHGRPVCIRVGASELERRFHRS